MDIGETLIESCEELYGDGNLSKVQYEKCVKNMNSDGNRRKSIKLLESKIFSDSRKTKEKKYDLFINSIENVIKKVTGNSITDERQKSNIIAQINSLLIQITFWIQQVSIYRHNNKESKHYNKLLQYYNKIDNNRKKIDKVESQLISLKEKENQVSNKMENKLDKRNVQINIMISLGIFLLISFIIIFLLYFI